MSRNRLFGLETEYAFSALGRNGQRLDRSEWASRFMEHAARKLPNLPDKTTGGMFLASGGRFYRDSGNHPELTTPEVTNPWDVCRYVDAGDRLMRQVADSLAHEHASGVQFVLNRSNVSYGPNQSTWACHESYGHRTSPDVFPDQLIPHLVSRIVYTGAGGFNNRTAGIEFLVSPRAAHIQQSISDRSQSDRGIFHTKDEPLSSNGNHRLHVLCGESVCSHLSNWLRVATTAIVVAMIEAGVSPASDVALRDPVTAMWNFARDPSLKEFAIGRDGRARTALDIQRHYLRQAEHHSGRDFMPPWAGEAILLWGKTLDQLAEGPDAVDLSLDWAIKRKLFQQTASRLGLEWKSIGVWSAVLVKLMDALIGAGAISPEHRLAPRGFAANLAQPGGPIGSVVSDLTPLLAQHELDWSQLPAVIQLRQQLLMLDVRFSELGPNGVFASLDAAGVLEHRVPGVDNIEHAMQNPPREGRARLRGETVVRGFPRRNEFSVSWSSVIDEGQRRILDLNDPFCETETWRQIPAPVPSDSPLTQSTDAAILQRATDAYFRGDYETGHQWLRVRLPHIPQGSLHAKSMQRMHSLLAARKGDLLAPQHLLAEAEQNPDDLSKIVDLACVYRFLGLRPRPEAAVWIERGLRCMAAAPGRQPAAAAVFRDHYSAWLMAEERWPEAKEQLEAARHAAPAGVCPRVHSRMLVSLAEVERRLGNADEAHRLTRIAERMQVERGFLGDFAEFTLPMQARLELNLEARLQILGRIRTVVAPACPPVARMRGILLEARVRDDSTRAAVLRIEAIDLANRAPALGDCRLVRRILDSWDDWIAQRPLCGATDFFAGV